MRDYKHFEMYLNTLVDDIYEQPVDDGHTRMALNVIDTWIPKLVGCKSVVDMGCGQIAPQGAFEQYGLSYLGISIGVDVVEVVRFLYKSKEYSTYDLADIFQVSRNCISRIVNNITWSNK